MERYNFSSDYQDLILACWMRHPEHFVLYGSVVSPIYFSGVNSQYAAECVIDCLNRSGVPPTPAVLSEMLVRKVVKLGRDDAVADARAYVEKLEGIDTRNVEDVKQNLVNFCRERALIRACQSVAEAVQSGTLDKVNPVKLAEEALMVGYNLEDDGLLLHADAEQVIERVTSEKFGIRTGYPLFDDIWRNGWGAGWLITVVAPPKRYKTAFCLNLALNMASPGIESDILYYACEIGEDLAAWRMLLRLAGVTDLEAKTSPLSFAEKARKCINEYVAGNIYIKGFSSKMATIQDIRLHAKHLINTKSIKPRAIFIDHAETVRPSASLAKNTPDHRQQSDIYTEARALANELKCAVVMPDRCNRETVDRNTPDMKSFQGAFEKAGIVDVALGLCATPEEYNDNIIRAFVFLNRHGAAFHHIRGVVDPERMNIEFRERIAYDPDADEHPRRRRVNLDDIDDANLQDRLHGRRDGVRGG